MIWASTRRSIARRLLVAFTGVWLYAALSPCLMAAGDPHCPDCPSSSTAAPLDENACQPAMTVDCALPELNPVTLDGSLDVPAPIHVLAIVPADAAAVPIAPFEHHAANAAVRAPPPLALRPAVLLR